MAENENEGTEAPTQRRRMEARKDGQVVSSPDISSTLAVLAGCLFMMWFGQSIGTRLLFGFHTWFRDIPATDWTDFHSQAGAQWMSTELMGGCGSFLLLLMGVGLAVGFAQSGFVISFKPMEVDFEKISPVKGWQNLMSIDSGVRGVLAAAKVVMLLVVAAGIIWARHDELASYNFESVGELFGFAWNLGLTVCLALTMVALILAAADYLVRWLRHEKKLKMTHEEIKREQKDETGDPTIRAALRRRQRDALRNQSVSDVPGATVVLTNPTHYAVALKYEAGRMSAPQLVAKGAGDFAASIIRIAKENKVPVVQRPPLTRAIFRSVDVGQEIPAEFFRAVAEILGTLYRARRQAA